MEYNISKHYGIHLSVENFLEYTNKSQPSVDDTLEYFNEVETDNATKINADDVVKMTLTVLPNLQTHSA
jgi:chorismate mutase